MDGVRVTASGVRTIACGPSIQIAVDKFFEWPTENNGHSFYDINSEIYRYTQDIAAFAQPETVETIAHTSASTSVEEIKEYIARILQQETQARREPRVFPSLGIPPEVEIYESTLPDIVFDELPHWNDEDVMDEQEVHQEIYRKYYERKNEDKYSNNFWEIRVVDISRGYYSEVRWGECLKSTDYQDRYRWRNTNYLCKTRSLALEKVKKKERLKIVKGYYECLQDCPVETEIQDELERKNHPLYKFWEF